MRKIWLFCGLFLAVAGTVGAQSSGKSTAFPADWVGEWTGDLRIVGPRGPLQLVPMSLSISPQGDGRYSWHIQYGPDTSGLRAYTLLTVDSTIGHYQIDENNGIVLDAFLLGNKLFSQFAVEDYLLLSTTSLQGDELLYEIVAGPREPALTTGDTEYRGETIPPVAVYGLSVRQYATLRRQ